ncbi:MAG: family 78 glycoside hydrolase catalytic domain [Planctomycetes bacterium]|nr:family 78 glycoside hydrolase catalytic domain [Planctomycetota bacterium]
MSKPSPLATSLAVALLLALCATQAEPAPAGAPAQDASPAAVCSLAVAHLRCEHLVEPTGVGERVPRLDWRLLATDAVRRGLSQSAYRVLAASDAATLARDEGDLWDSGRVASDATTDVAWAGRALRSGQSVFWKVRVWDERGTASDWSPVAHFGVGLLEPSDWRARWIGFDAPRAEAERDLPSLAGARWIWLAGEDALDASTDPRRFRKVVSLAGGAEIEQAELVVTADDQWRVFLDGVALGGSPDEVDAWKHPSVFDVTTRLGPGTHVLGVEARNAHRGPAGLLARLVVRTTDGSRRVFATDAGWLASADAHADWGTPSSFEEDGWSSAAEVGEVGCAPWGPLRAGGPLLPPPRLLRHDVTLATDVARATLYATALGLLEVEIDGARVGDDALSPGWTDYTRRVNVRAYDVTANLARGEHALGVILADGWHSGYVGYAGERDLYGERTRARVQLEVEYVDGTRDVFASDADWRASTGPLRSSDLLMGEVYDARRELDGWSSPGFDDSGWAPVDVDGVPSGVELDMHPGPPIRVWAEVAPKTVTQVDDDRFVVDFGQNLAGVVRLSLRGARGQRVVLRHGERLSDDGSLYTTNLRSARATDEYVCRGHGLETFTPRFTFHGFQYVEVTGLGRAPDAGTLTALALSSDTPLAGRFACSDPMLDTLVRNTLWTQRSNFLDVPTDCPQRDERLGWTGDAQTFIRTATYLTDSQAFYAKWLVDLMDAQRADGQFPMVAPLAVAGDDGGPAWADAGVICPLGVWDAYGDRRVLARCYPAMKRFVDFSLGRTVELLPPAQFHCFGDWVALGADTPHTVIFEAYLARSTQLLADAAAALGRDDDARRYAQVASDVRAAFRRAYVDDDARVAGDTQCAYVLALAFDLLEPQQRARAAEHLVERVAERDWHLSTGFVGTKDLLPALSKIGRDDVAWTLLEQRSYPSWGFTIANGATSIWERWDGWTPERGFQDPGMNSFAHYAFGAVTQWMFERAGGIRPLAAGFSEVEVAPVPGGDVTWVDCAYDSIRGTIASRWRLLDDGARLELEVDVPPNVRARIRVPTRAPTSITEGKRSAADAPGLAQVASDADGVVFAVGSGMYRFACDAPIVRRLDEHAPR